MSLEPFLRRELTTATRTGRLDLDRMQAVVWGAIVLVATFAIWDWRLGRERSSIAGAYQFGVAMAGALVAAIVGHGYKTLVTQVARAIASERDRKSLDALLASRFTSAEIVLGAMACGLLRHASALTALIPYVVLVVVLAGIAPLLAVLVGLGLAVQAALMASFAALASVGARTGTSAVRRASGSFFFLMMVPAFVVLIRPILWPGAPWWVGPPFLFLTQFSPMGLLLNLGGIVPRPGGLVEGLARLALWQGSLALALTAWAIARLRPASRDHHDVEGQATRTQQLKAALRRPARRPPCGDDPVFWQEAHGTRRAGAAWRFVGRICGLLMLGGLALVTYWLAAPAFAELLQRGYGPSRAAHSMPDLNPLARLLINRTLGKLAIEATPGQARLEFNIVLRVFTGMVAMGFALICFGGAVESLGGERQRDTWLGLIATPLTGGEILRGKALGLIWKARAGLFVLLTLWTLGLAAGSVHPLGFVAAVACFAVVGAFYTAQGLSVGLRETYYSPRGTPLQKLGMMVAVLFLGLTMMVVPVTLAWASLLTYEDVQSLANSGPFPQFDGSKLDPYLGARSVAILFLIGTTALALGAFLFSRSTARNFDAAVGRPVRGELGALAPPELGVES